MKAYTNVKYTLFFILPSLFVRSQTLQPCTITNVSGSNSITCATPSIHLVASFSGGNVTFYWASSSFTAAGSNATLTSPGTCSVFGSVSGSPVCFQTVSIGVNTVAPVSALIPTLQNITCNASSIQQHTAAATSPTTNITHYWISPQGGSVAVNSYTSIYLPGGAGIYTLTTTNNVNGCQTAKTFTVNSSSGFPTFSLSSSPANFTLGCSSLSTLTVSIVNPASTPTGGVTSYTLLSPGASTALPSGNLSSVIIYTINTPGTYTAAVMDNANGCTTRSPFTVLQNTVGPIISVNASSLVVCPGGTVQLTASGADTYAWSGGITNGVPFAPTGTGSYTVTGTSTLTGCSGSTYQTVTVDATLTPVPITINASSTLVCSGTPVVLTATGANTYTWTGGITNGVAFNPTVAGTYSVSGTGSSGCISYNQTFQSIAIVPAPSITITPASSVHCVGNTATLTASGANSYTWTGGGLGAIKVVGPSANSVYTVMGTNSQGCEGQGTYSLDFSPASTFNYSTTGQSAVFAVSNSSCNTYTWTLGDGSTIVNNPNPSITYNSPGIYVVCLKCAGIPCESCLTLSVPGNVMGGVGISEHQASTSYAIYPNPSNGLLVIEINEPTEMVITNALGQKVLEKNLTDRKTVLDLQGQNNGIYLVRLKNATRTQTVKIIKEEN